MILSGIFDDFILLSDTQTLLITNNPKIIKIIIINTYFIESDEYSPLLN